MKKYILFFVASSAYFQSFGQVTFDISEFEFGTDTIISMAIGDPDNNQRDDIFITANGKNLVYKLQNGTSGFTKTNYLSKNKPEIFKLISLNGGDDIVYTEKGKSSLNLAYGKDEYYSEKSIVGELKIDSTVNIKYIGDVQPVENLFSNRILYCIDNKNTFHLFNIYTSSFNSIAPDYMESIPTAFGLGQTCGYYFDNRVSRIFIPDQANGKFMAMVKDWNNFQNPSIEPNLELIDSNLEKPVACLTYATSQKDDVMFLLDAGKSAVYKYYLNENYRREEFKLELDNPTQLASGFIDDNDLLDLLILDNNKLWLVSDLHKGRSGATQTLLVEESGTIKNLQVFDYDNNGFSDIIYNLQGGNRIKVLKNEQVSSVEDQNSNRLIIKPNPARDRIQIDEPYDDLKIFDMKGNETNFSIQDKIILLEGFVKGQYIIKLTYNGKKISRILLVE